MKVISRRELFELAWEKPLVRVAADFGITSTGLKKICARHDIPVPSRGYWQAVAAGKVFPRPKLWPAKNPNLEQVRIVGAPPLPPTVEAAVAEAQAKISALHSDKSDAEPSKRVPAALEAAASASASALAVSVVAATEKALARAKPNHAGFLSVSGKNAASCTVGEASVERALSWLRRFIGAAEAQGYRLAVGDHGPVLLVDGEPIGFHLEEKPERSPHTPTSKELAAKAERMKWGWTTDPWPKYDHSPSGDLSVVIDGAGYSGLRRTYSDGRGKRLEDKAEEILVAFAAHAALLKDRRREREERERKAAEAEVRRRREEAFQRREARRGEFVDAIAEQLAKRERLAAVLEHLGSSGPNASRLDPMAHWLRGRLALIDALLSPRFLELSARHAGAEFDEARAGEAQEAAYYYSRTVELHLWSIDEAAGRATIQSVLEWRGQTSPSGQ